MENTNEFNSMDGEVTSYEIPTALAPQARNYIDEAAIQNETINASGEEQKSNIEKKLLGADEKHFLPTMLFISGAIILSYYVAKKQGWLN